MVSYIMRGNFVPKRDETGELKRKKLFQHFNMLTYRKKSLGRPRRRWEYDIRIAASIRNWTDSARNKDYVELNFTQRPIFSVLRFFNEPQALESRDS